MNTFTNSYIDISDFIHIKYFYYKLKNYNKPISNSKLKLHK